MFFLHADRDLRQEQIEARIWMGMVGGTSDPIKLHCASIRNIS